MGREQEGQIHLYPDVQDPLAPVAPVNPVQPVKTEQVEIGYPKDITPPPERNDKSTYQQNNQQINQNAQYEGQFYGSDPVFQTCKV